MRYAVIGAGAAGLTLAWRLSQAGASVVVYDRSLQPGGLAGGFRLGNGWIESFYHHIFRSDRTIQTLLRELGMERDLVWTTPRTVVLADGAMRALDSAESLLRYTPLPPRERVRMAAALAYLKLTPSPQPLEGSTAAAWIQRWMGDAAYRQVWQPLLVGKFGDAADTVTAPWFWARIHDRSRTLGYLRGGFQRLYNRMAEQVQRNGGVLRLGVAVTSVRPASPGLNVVSAHGATLFDRVISTLPPRLSYALAPDLPTHFVRRFDPGDARAAQCVILALSQPLSRAYWINVTDRSAPFTVVVEHTNLAPACDYGGCQIVYLGSYRAGDDPRLTRSSDDLIAQATPMLTQINPRFRREWVTDAWSMVARDAQPIVTTTYRTHIPPMVTPLPGYYLLNMFQVYPHDRGQNYAMASAERLARRLLHTQAIAVRRG